VENEVMDDSAGTSAVDRFEDIPRIPRRTLHDEVLNQLRDMIIEGRLAPGARINEVQIGAALGVSRTPLREAIKTLASEGLVDVVPARGAVVRRFQAADLVQIVEVLKQLEQLGGRLACERASDSTIAGISALHDRMMELYAARNRLEYFKLNQAIHTAIVQASGNAILAETHTMLQSRIKRMRFIGNGSPEKWAGAVAEHEEMIAALKARDGDRLVAVLGQHLDATIVRVRDVI
jgi:DNA-binding GntR family transcriptional regulator